MKIMHLPADNMKRMLESGQISKSRFFWSQSQHRFCRVLVFMLIFILLLLFLVSKQCLPLNGCNFNITNTMNIIHVLFAMNMLRLD